MDSQFVVSRSAERHGWGRRAGGTGNQLRLTWILLAGLLTAALLVVNGGGDAFAQSAAPGAVYTLTNGADSNRVLVWARAENGVLSPVGSYATGGRGSGDGLGSQGALILSGDGNLLFAVNAGSNDISVFGVGPERLTLVDRVASGGSRPISLTLHDNLLYVLNAGEAGNIYGFRVGGDGHLTPLAGSTRPLSGAATGPAQVQFSPDGRVLVVTEKMTNMISTYVVDSAGMATGPMVQPSAGAVPFGFAFDAKGRLLVSEAMASALSSYRVDEGGRLNPISPSVVNGQGAACWTVVTEDGRFAYTANAQTGTVSGYRVGDDGALTLLDTGRTGITGGNPTDMAMSADSRFVYVLTSATNAIWGFRVDDAGGLTPVPGAVNLPAGVVGLAAR